MSSGGDYKPTEHDGLKKDGTPDKRVGTGGMLPPPHSNHHHCDTNNQQNLHKEKLILMRLEPREDKPVIRAVEALEGPATREALRVVNNPLFFLT